MLPWLSDKVLPYEWAAAVFSTREWRFEEKISSSYFLYIQIIFHVNLELLFRVYIMYSVLFQHQKKKKKRNTWSHGELKSIKIIVNSFRKYFAWFIITKYGGKCVKYCCVMDDRVSYASLRDSIHMCFIIVVALFSTWTNYTKRKNKCSFRWNLFLLNVNYNI